MEYFIDAKFGDCQFSALGLIRINEGRISENLGASMLEVAQDVPAGDGSYFFGASEGAMQINVPFAFDNLTEGQLRQIQQVFNRKDLQRLYLPECGDGKYYMAKPTGNIVLKHLCFVNPNGQKVYKGEGSVTFTVYWPELLGENNNI